MRLYKISNGKLREWAVWTVGAEVHRTFGYVDGQYTSVHYIAEGKNIGKKNETSADEQAVLEAEALVRQQIKDGYWQTEGEAWQNEETFKAMKLHKAIEINRDTLDFEYTRHFEKMPPIVYLQEKFDGCFIAIKKDDAGNVSFWSRGNKEFLPLRKVAVRFRAYLENVPNNVILIGEAFCVGERETTVSGWLRKKEWHPDIERLEFVIFDYWDGTKITYLEKLDNLREMFPYVMGPVFLIDTEQIDKDSAVSYAKTMVDDFGWEGAILRSPESTYNCGKRSRDTLKVKWFQTIDLPILGFTLGPKNNVLGMFEYEGKQFNCSLNFADEQCRFMYENQEQYIGMIAVIVHFDFTTENLPKIGKVYEIRERDI